VGTFGLIVIGDEILSGKRADKHLPKIIELLGARGLSLGWAEYVGDSPARITAALQRAFASGDVVFSTGGIGATPDDHTRQCAARALGVDLVLHPEAAALILERMQDIAREQGKPYEPERPDNAHRLNMGVFPAGAQIIPNPYNKIPGFSCYPPRPDMSAAGPPQGAKAPAGGQRATRSGRTWGRHERRRAAPRREGPQENLMAKTVADVMKMVKENEVKFVDFRFTDTRGKEQHVTVPVSHFRRRQVQRGHAFDGSSIAGWKGIEASDMQLMPDPNTANIDPFFEEPTLILTCDVVEPADGKAYDRDPRSLAKRAEAYLKASGMGDTAYFGPEPEFFIFDSVRWSTDMSGCFSRSKSTKPPGTPARKLEGGNRGHRPDGQGRLLPGAARRQHAGHARRDVPDPRILGIPVEVFHHEVAGAGQNEIGTKFSTLVERADWTSCRST
jgi:molybdopterin-biosynthesis enzyme MoeA-like protein